MNQQKYSGDKPCVNLSSNVSFPCKQHRRCLKYSTADGVNSNLLLCSEFKLRPDPSDVTLLTQTFTYSPAQASTEHIYWVSSIAAGTACPASSLPLPILLASTFLGSAVMGLPRITTSTFLGDPTVSASSFPVEASGLPHAASTSTGMAKMELFARLACGRLPTDIGRERGMMVNLLKTWGGGMEACKGK